MTLLSAAYRETSSYTQYQAEMEVAVISCLLGKLYSLIADLLQVRFCLIVVISTPIMLWPVELLHGKYEHDFKRQYLKRSSVEVHEFPWRFTLGR